MGNAVLFQPEDTPTSLGQMVNGGASHTADTDNYRVIAGHGVTSGPQFAVRPDLGQFLVVGN